MVKVRNIESSLLVEAVLVWTHWGQTAIPCRDDSLVIDRFGAELGPKLLEEIKFLKKSFYLSDAKFVAEDLEEMELMSSDQFRKKHPEVPDEIVKAFAWCYIYDFK